jgi:spore coat protein H
MINMLRLLGFLLILIIPSCLLSQIPFIPDGWVYSPNEVSKIEILIDTDSLAFILDPANASSNHEFPATLVFTNGNLNDTLTNIGFRLRGNTSRQADKKSFKVSINSFTSGRRYQGFKDFNLNGEHNDPSISRARIAWEFASAEGIASSRCVHSELYINGEYKGLYINTEHINNDWLSHRFGNNTGNLYKCTYPANLQFISTNPSDYKLTKNNGERVYELKTNEVVDDYTKLAQFIDILNNTPQNQLVCSLDSVFNIESYLQALAFEVIMGHWDNYSFNQNNYYLYENPQTGKIEYIPYDIDNSMGVDWFGIDWATRDVNNWHNAGQNFPLSDRLLLIPSLKEIYQFYLRDYATKIGSTTFTNRIDSIKNQINSYAYADTFKSLDYGFSNSDFDLSFTTNQANQHVKKGIKPYLSTRSSTALNQLGTFNVAPIIHSPSANASSLQGQVVFKALVVDESISSVSCSYSLSGGASQSIILYDDGLHNDGQANDGIYANAIAQPTSGNISYQITASDTQGKQSTKPCTANSISIRLLGDLVINEFMADNDNTIADNNGDYNDWIELYNNSSDSIFLGDYYLSDNGSTPFEWQLPAEYLDAGDFIIFWASSDTTAGIYHTNFGLSKGGEEIILAKNTNGQVDTADLITFGAQTSDISFGRSYDASPTWISFSVPTPNASNGTLSLEALKGGLNFSAYPNPYSHSFNLDNSNASDLHYQLLDLQGRVLRSGKVASGASISIYDESAKGLRIMALSLNGEAVLRYLLIKN